MTHPEILTDETLDDAQGGSDPQGMIADDPAVPLRIQLAVQQRIMMRKRALIDTGARIAYAKGELEEFRDTVRDVTGRGGE